LQKWISEHEKEWKMIGETTSSHLKILAYEIDEKDDHLFLTIAADTDEAMGMNMVTIAAQAIGAYIEKSMGVQFITVAANVDSDKKSSLRTHTKGRGYEATATCTLQPATITEILKTTPEAMLAAAKAKLEIGSSVAGAIGKNCHAANVIAALYLATGQDAAHVVEGSMADTTVASCKLQVADTHSLQPATCNASLRISVRLPALLLGIRGGGTTLPAQKQCLNILLGNPANPLHPCKRLAEIIAAAVLAGEISLLAAQSSHTLAKAHKDLGR
jgi:hydroxymethylglutaryl-CoA reductase (NADPH)